MDLEQLLQSTEGLVAKVDENLKILDSMKIGEEVKGRIQPLVTAYLAEKGILYEKKRELLVALMDISPQITTARYGSVGSRVEITSATDLLVESSQGMQTYFVDRFMTDPKHCDKFYPLCRDIVSRIEISLTNSATDHPTQVANLKQLLGKIKSFTERKAVPAKVRKNKA